MKTAEDWLRQYAATHRHPLNKKIHMICVPAIFWSVIALLWACPTPTVIAPIPWLNWAMIGSVPALIFYLSQGAKYFMSLGVAILLSFVACYQIEVTGHPLGWIALGVFVVAWIGQFYGHKVEGRKPAFLDDLLFLLIGPMWIIEYLLGD